MAIGVSAGVVGTIVFATVWQKQFDRLIGRARSASATVGDCVDGLVNDLSEDATKASTSMAESAHRGVDKVDHASKVAIETVRSKIVD